MAKIKIFLIFTVAFFELACASSAARKSKVVGGACLYDKFKGECRIISVSQTEGSKQQARQAGGPGYEGFEVKFRFIPDTKIKISKGDAVYKEWAKDKIMNDKHLLILNNSWYPGEKFLKKYNIAPDAVFDCTADVITKGTCTPIIFEFDKIDRSDYF